VKPGYYPMPEREDVSDEDRFLTVARAYDAVLMVKGSRFLARVAPVSSTAGPERVVEEIRRAYRDATHHCFAFRVGYVAGRIERFSDAGEPSGTAGRPILQALQSKRVWDIVAVVTRYFGGVKLGPGGLRRAYRKVTEVALEDVTLISRGVVSSYNLRFDHAMTGAVYRVIGEFEGLVTSTGLGSRVRLGVTVKRSAGPSFCRRLVDAGRGAIEVRHAGEGVR